MKKASTRLPEQGTQTPSPAPDLIPAETENQPRTNIKTGTANGGTSGEVLASHTRPQRPKQDLSGRPQRRGYNPDAPVRA
jgi:hypothetical protein